MTMEYEPKLGDRIATWTWGHHARSEDKGPDGVVVNLNPLTIRCDDGRECSYIHGCTLITPAQKEGPTFWNQGKAVEDWYPTYATAQSIRESIERLKTQLAPLEVRLNRLRTEARDSCDHTNSAGGTLVVGNRYTARCALCGKDFGDPW